MKQTSFLEKYGPWAIVTGASSGIGYAIAKQIAEAGLNVILVSRSVNALDQLAEEIRRVHSVECRVLVSFVIAAGHTAPSRSDAVRVKLRMSESNTSAARVASSFGFELNCNMLYVSDVEPGLYEVLSKT